jgi:hypothetical protein
MFDPFKFVRALGEPLRLQMLTPNSSDRISSIIIVTEPAVSVGIWRPHDPKFRLDRNTNIILTHERESCRALAAEKSFDPHFTNRLRRAIHLQRLMLRESADQQPVLGRNC